MTSIKPPLGSTSIGPQSTQSVPSNKQADALSTLQKAAQEAGVKLPQGIMDPKAIAEAIDRFKKMRDRLKTPFFSGTAGLFTGEVVFPEGLLDPSDPSNDSKYLHLICTLFGLKELEKIFSSQEQQKEKEEQEEEEALVKKVLGKKKPNGKPLKKNK
ncbi:MAG TPA: hypothetical protein DDW49_03150 [Deltaproteobacteria bacterium]|nr:MAG: hypothetical protein A2048_04575 [Deltaproteobacteria bacterium GWA2_45_12]HBF12378.1 hypothetical protein [Deltaproteobacteria bacterium]